MTPLYLPSCIAADPAVAKAVEIYERGQKARHDAEAKFNHLKGVGVPSCSEPFDDTVAAARELRARKYDEVHGTDTAAAERTAIESERAACRKAHAKSMADAEAATARIDNARLEFEAADSVMHGTKDRLWILIKAKAAELLPGLQAEYAKNAAALHKQALELRAVDRSQQNPLSPYEDPRPFEFGVPLPWRNREADEIALKASGAVAVDMYGRLAFHQ